MDTVFSLPGLIALLGAVSVILAAYAVMGPKKYTPNKSVDTMDIAGLNIDANDANSERIRKVIRQFSPALGRLNELSPDKKDKLILLFIRSKNPWNLRPEEFLPVRILSAFVGGIIGVIAVALEVDIVPSPILILMFMYFGYLYPYSVYNSAQQKRSKDIQRNLPKALDLLVITMKSGSNFMPAMESVTPRIPQGPLHEEFEQINKELQAGRPTKQTLLAFANRSSSEEAQNFAKSVVQAEELGTDVSETLTRQAEAARESYAALLDQKVAKLNTKMFTTLSITMIPALLLILLLPGVEVFMTGLNGGS